MSVWPLITGDCAAAACPVILGTWRRQRWSEPYRLSIGHHKQLRRMAVTGEPVRELAPAFSISCP